MCPPAELESVSSSEDVVGTGDNIPTCVPSDPLSRAAYLHAKQHLHPLILSHSLRVFVYMIALSEREQTHWHDYDHIPLLFASAMFHDFGTTKICNGPERFEVEGADAAVAFLSTQGISVERSHEIWVAIACHTSAGIGERISTLGKLQRLGPLVDFKRPDVMALVDRSFVTKNEDLYPRGEIEKVLSDTVVAQALQQRSRAPPATWPGVLMRFKDENPDWDGVNKEF
jgi:hypothetical protein